MSSEMEALLKLAAWDMNYDTDVDKAYRAVSDMDTNGWETNPEKMVEFYNAFVNRAMAAGWRDIPSPAEFMGSKFMEDMVDQGLVPDPSTWNMRPISHQGVPSQDIQGTGVAAGVFNKDDAYWTTLEGQGIFDMLDQVTDPQDAVFALVQAFPSMHQDDIPPQVRYLIEDLMSGNDQADPNSTSPQSSNQNSTSPRPPAPNTIDLPIPGGP